MPPSAGQAEGNRPHSPTTLVRPPARRRQSDRAAKVGGDSGQRASGDGRWASCLSGKFKRRLLLARRLFRWVKIRCENRLPCVIAPTGQRRRSRSERSAWNDTRQGPPHSSRPVAFLTGFHSLAPSVAPRAAVGPSFLLDLVLVPAASPTESLQLEADRHLHRPAFPIHLRGDGFEG